MIGKYAKMLVKVDLRAIGCAKRTNKVEVDSGKRLTGKIVRAKCCLTFLERTFSLCKHSLMKIICNENYRYLLNLLLQ